MYNPTGYMLLYLTVIQSTARLVAHILPTKIASAVLTALLVLLCSYGGGYSIHLRQIPKYWSWIQNISPQRWLLPLLIADEYSADTLANTAANQLCRNKQVSFLPHTVNQIMLFTRNWLPHRYNIRKLLYNIHARHPTEQLCSPTYSCCPPSPNLCLVEFNLVSKSTQ